MAHGRSRYGGLVPGTILAVAGTLGVVVEAAPLGLAAGSVPSPGLLACAVAAVAIRRPAAAAVLLVFALGLLRDLLTDVPPGAGALSLVLLSETLRAQSEMFRRRAFAIELVWVAACLLGMLALQYILVLLTLSQPPYLMGIVRQWALSVAVYPAVALALRWLAGIRWDTRPGSTA